MDVSFADPRLEDRCEKEKDLRRCYGDRQAKKIMLRIQHMKIAKTLAELRTMPGRLHPLSADRSGDYAMDLVHPDRLVFTVEVPDGHNVWSTTEVKINIVEIIDYH
ncbi:hypothetical protein WY02_20535 [Pseudonocardia sp. AL041005-10]|nr:hypothetical protein [Pseudonocardia sp. AL041005-10]ALE80401.1 hypothetical protein WY02_20535 [Pseudonocardia sp. AL041005-10]